MKVRFNTDADDEPHIYRHNVEIHEVLEALARPLERVPGSGDTTIVIGRTRSGRVLRVVHAPSRDGDGIFVVTAIRSAGQTIPCAQPPPETEAPKMTKRRNSKHDSSGKTQSGPRPRRRRLQPGDYPRGWDQKRAAALAEYYDNQSDAEAIAEAEAAYHDPATAMVPVPVELVAEVNKLIARRRQRRAG